MKKGKKTMIVTIGLICFVLSYVMFMQFKTVEETNITEIENMSAAELREKSVAWRERYEETNLKLEETNAKLEEYKQKKESDQEASELLEQELLQARILAGETDVKGDGVIVTITDRDDTEKIVANDLIGLVNELKLAGAEAISINDQRIVNMSDIVDINGTFIKVNGKRILAPYIIKAIGNQSYLESALIGNGGHVDDMRKLGQDVSITKSNKITILKYNDEINTKYIEDIVKSYMKNNEKEH